MDWKEPTVLMLQNSAGSLDYKGEEVNKEINIENVDIKQEITDEHTNAAGAGYSLPQTEQEMRDEHGENKIKVEEVVVNWIMQPSAKPDESGSMKTENVKIEEIYLEEEMKVDDEDDTAGDIDPLADDPPAECQEEQGIIDNQDAEFGEEIGNLTNESNTEEPVNSQHQIANSYLNELGGKDKNEFVCYICNIKTPVELSLLQHLKCHVDGDLYKCLRCSYKTGYTKELKGHMSIHNPSEVYKCDMCCYCTDFQTSLRRHKNISHSNRIRHMCRLCDYRTNNQNYYKLHFLLHMGKITYTCKMCNYRTLRRINVKTHISMHAGQRTHPCPSCSYSAYHTTDLRMHLQTHGNKGQFKCNLCNLGFARKRGLKQHLRTHNGNI